MKLNFEAMQILMGELQQAEMWAIYLMGQGKAMPDTVTKFDLTKIIQVLCKRLKWIEEESESEDTSRVEVDDKEVLINSLVETNMEFTSSDDSKMHSLDANGVGKESVSEDSHRPKNPLSTVDVLTTNDATEIFSSMPAGDRESRLDRLDHSEEPTIGVKVEEIQPSDPILENDAETGVFIANEDSDKEETSELTTSEEKSSLALDKSPKSQIKEQQFVCTLCEQRFS